MSTRRMFAHRTPSGFQRCNLGFLLQGAIDLAVPDSKEKAPSGADVACPYESSTKRVVSTGRFPAFPRNMVSPFFHAILGTKYPFNADLLVDVVEMSCSVRS